MRRAVPLRALAVGLAATGLVACAGADSGEPETAPPDDTIAPPTVVVTAPAGIALARGETVRVPLEVRIDPAVHVMANPASEDWFVPMTLEISTPAGVEAGMIRYPEGIPFAVDGIERPLATYQERVVLTLPLTADDDATPGPRTVEGRLRYQGCSRHACLIPSGAPVRFEVVVR